MPIGCGNGLGMRRTCYCEKTWYISQLGDGAKDGTSLSDAWDIGSITWGAGGITSGDTVYLTGTITSLITVGSDNIKIRGDLADNLLTLNGGAAIDQGILIDNKTGVQLIGGTYTNCLVSNISWEGTSTGATFDVITTNAGNQGVQHLDTVSVIHNNITTTGNADDGISGHGSSVIVINGLVCTGNDQGVNVIADANCTITGSTTFSGNTTNDLFSTAATSDESCYIDITGATLPTDVTASQGGKVILRNCTVSGSLNIAAGGAGNGFLDSYIGTFSGAVSYGAGADVNDNGISYTSTLAINASTVLSMTDCVVTPDMVINFDFTASSTIFNGQVRFSVGGTSDLSNCLINTLYTESAGTISLTECYVKDNTALSGTMTAIRCLLNGVNATDHIIDVISGGDLDIKYSNFKGMPSGKFGIAARTGSTITALEGCTFVGASNVGSGVFIQVDTTAENCIFTDLDNGYLRNAGTSIMNNCCVFDNNTDVSGTATQNDCITTDPKLTDVSTNDFSLDTGSSCLGTGITLTEDEGIDTADWGDGTTETPDVTTKQQTAPWDVGAYIS